MSGGKSIAAAVASTAGSVFVAKLIPKLLKLSYNQTIQEFVNIKATMINKKNTFLILWSILPSINISQHGSEKSHMIVPSFSVALYFQVSSD